MQMIMIDNLTNTLVFWQDYSYIYNILLANNYIPMSNIQTTIKSMREKFHLTQQEIADSIWISRTAYSQIELWQRNVSINEAQCLASVFGVTIDEIVWYEVLKKSIKKNDKNYGLKQLILYISSRVASRPNFGETLLNKLLYFSDFDYCEWNGENLTGATYIKQPFGPVPDGMKNVLHEMQEEWMISMKQVRYHDKTQTKIIPLVSEIDTSVFDKEIPDDGKQWKEIVDLVLDKFSAWSASQLSEYSHNDRPYLSTVHYGDVIDAWSVFYRDENFSVRKY